MNTLARIRLIKSYMQPDGKIIPRGKIIDVEEDIAVMLENSFATSPNGRQDPRAIRVEKSEEIAAYEVRVQKTIDADRAKRALAKKP